MSTQETLIEKNTTDNKKRYIIIGLIALGVVAVVVIVALSLSGSQDPQGSQQNKQI